GSPHAKDAGVMSPRVLRTPAVALEMSNVGRNKGIELFKRTSQTSTGTSSSSTLASSARRLLEILKRFSRWRDRAEKTIGPNQRAESSSPRAADPSPWRNEGWGDGSFDLDKSRDLRIAVEALRRHSERHGAIDTPAIEDTVISKDKASLSTLEFLQRLHEIKFRTDRLAAFVTSRCTRVMLLIMLISYSTQTIELVTVEQQPPVIVLRLLLARLTVLTLLVVLYVLYWLRRVIPASVLRLFTVGVYILGVLVTSLHTTLFLGMSPQVGCKSDDPTCDASEWAKADVHSAAMYQSYATSLELTMWIMMINFNAALLFKHLIFTNVVIITPVLVAWNLGDSLAYELALETSLLAVSFAIMAMIMARIRESWERRIYLTDIEYRSWQQRAQRLLSEFMPSSALEAYLADKYIASLYKNMTLLFADICNYTAYAENTRPERVVSLLTSLFSQFDYLSDTYAIYKVHTIGDAYVASTEPKEGVDKVQSAERMVAFAQAMVEALRAVREEMSAPELEMRIGLHFGKFVGGVIATTKINYDIFGVDVTIANQVEAAGIPGKIVASDTLRGYLCHHFPGKYRFRFHTAIEILLPDRCKNQRPTYSHRGVVSRQLKVYEISTNKVQYGEFETA
ncbi:hypothetical protein FOZ62_017268, partial [Perkinsus olseni]